MHFLRGWNPVGLSTCHKYQQVFLPGFEVVLCFSTKLAKTLSPKSLTDFPGFVCMPQTQPFLTYLQYPWDESVLFCLRSSESTDANSHPISCATPTPISIKQHQAIAKAKLIVLVLARTRVLGPEAQGYTIPSLHGPSDVETSFPCISQSSCCLELSMNREPNTTLGQHPLEGYFVGASMYFAMEDGKLWVSPSQLLYPGMLHAGFNP